jgi:hypothetical protein
MAVAPPERRLKHLMEPVEPNVERYDDAPHHQGFDGIERDFQTNKGRRHYAARI